MSANCPSRPFERFCEFLVADDRLRLLALQMGTTPLSPPMPCYTATMSDEPRQDATDLDQYALTIEEAALRYEHAGYPRTLRSIQRYCAKGDLDCLRQETTFGDKFMITPQSVARHIAQIDELASATHRDPPRQGATTVAVQMHGDKAERPAPTNPDQPRPDVPGLTEKPEAVDDRYVHQLERENDFLRGQIAVKDEQIAEMGVRARETNVLIKGLQELYLALNPGRPQQQSSEHAPRDAQL